VCTIATGAFALSGEPYEKARPDSRIVRRLLATPIPENTRDVNYVAAALEMLGQDNAQVFNTYLERAEWLAALGEPPLRASTVAEAVALEAQAEPIDKVRARAFGSLLVVELAKPNDPLPEGIRAARDRYRQETPVVWDLVEQNPEAPMRLLHVAVTNAGKRDLAGFWGDVFLDTTPPVAVRCEAQADSSFNAVLRAGQRRSQFCITEWQKKVPLKTLADAAKAVEEKRATLTMKPRWILLQGAAFDLQDGGSSYFRRPFPTTGFDSGGRQTAAGLVRDSSCWDRGTCADFLTGGMRELQPLSWMALASGVIAFALAAAFSGWRVRAKTLWIITAAAAIVPILVFAALLGNSSLGLGVLVVPVMGAFLWGAFLVGLWGSWLVSLPFRRRATA
jgi:hypothetical protein